MTIIASNALINVGRADCVYVDNSGYMHIDVGAGTLFLKNIPDNALQQVAMAIAECKRYIEFEDAELVVSEEEGDDISSDIE